MLYIGTVPMGTVEFWMMAVRQASKSPPVERSMTVSAFHFSAQRSFSTSSSMDDDTGLAPMLALILVNDALPMHIGCSLYFRWTLLAGMIIRPVAISKRICSGVRWGSRVAT